MTVVVSAAANAIYYQRMKCWAENESLPMNYDIEFSRRFVLLLPRSIDKETIAIDSVVPSRYSKEPVKLETFKIQLQVCQIRSDFLPDDEFV